MANLSDKDISPLAPYCVSCSANVDATIKLEAIAVPLPLVPCIPPMLPVDELKSCGLSKLNRIVNFFARRPQVQERLNEQIFYALEYILHTSDIAVLMQGEHLCVKSRGVGDINSEMTTSKLGGGFYDIDKLRNGDDTVVYDIKSKLDKSDGKL